MIISQCFQVFHVVTNGHFKFNQYKWSQKSQRCAPQIETDYLNPTLNPFLIGGKCHLGFKFQSHSHQLGSFQSLQDH